MSPADAAAAAPLPGRHPLVRRILQGGVADAIRLTAARGTLPIPAHDLVYLQVELLNDSEETVAQAAAESLAAVPVETAAALLKEKDCDPGVLDHFARSGRLPGEVLATAVAHPNTPHATLEALAASDDPATLNLLVTNEQRVINNPALFKALRENTHLRPENRRRLHELELDFIGKEPLVIKRRPEPAAEPEPPSPDEGPGEAAAEGAGEAAPETDEATPSEEEMAAEEAAPIPTAEDEEDLRSTMAFQKILQMGVPERVQLAMKGSAEERAILIRDTTKIVALQVLKSPKLGENEITNFAQMRNVHEDILRKIAGKRAWTKSYNVIHALIKNPKTPSGLSVQFLSRLGVRDLNLMTRDKNIPDGLRRAARNIFLARTQKAGMKKKH
jgi:hypothetical protein